MVRVNCQNGDGGGSWVGHKGQNRFRNFHTFAHFFREGVNREKLTVKKFIDNEMFFFSPFMSLTNREKSA